MFVCHLSADLPHSTLQFPRRQLSGEDRQDQINKRTVSLRENLFRVGGEGVGGVRFADPGLCSGLVDKSITLQAEQMSAHRVVSQLQRCREVIHSLIPAPQQLENLSPSAFQDSFAPSGMFHDRSIKARLNKSKKALTNIAEMTGPLFCRAGREKRENHDVLHHVDEEGPSRS